MADTFVQLATDGAGKKMDTRTEGTNSEHRQVMVIGDPATNAGVAPVDATKGLAVDLTASGSLPGVTTVTTLTGTTTLTPGIGATNLGKAEDAAHTSGDVGVMTLAVRNDAGSVLAGSDGDYVPLTTDATGALRTDLNSSVSSNNSTTATLTSGSIFTGTSDDALNYNEIRITLIASHASASDGLSIQQSSDNSNWDISDTYTIPATTGKTFVVPRQARYVRVVYTNGGTNQTSFRMQTLLNRIATASSSQRASDAYSNENDLAEVWAFNSLYNGTTWDRMRGDTTNGLDVDVTRLASGVVQSGAFASGSVGSGAIASGAIASGAVASGAFSSGSISAGAIAAGATSIADNEDVASADGDRGVKVLAVRKATPANSSGTDGDYEFLQMSAGRVWASATIDTALPAGSNTIGALTANQSVNVSQMNGVTTAMGVGASSTGTQRIVSANDNGKTIVSKGGSAASSGNNTLVAAGSNRLKVKAFSLTTTSTTAMTCIFQDGASGTELWRVIIQAVTGASSGANLSVPAPDWLFATSAATLLNLNLSSANVVHWSVSYYDEA